MFSYSQDDWESNLNLTYPLFKETKAIQVRKHPN